MEDKKITPEELKAAWAGDVDELAAKVAAAMNSAQPGNIIDDSEEPVRDASAEFRQRLYQKTGYWFALSNMTVKQTSIPSSGRQRRLKMLSTGILQR